jgi:methionyl-tRNA synthetase
MIVRYFDGVLPSPRAKGAEGKGAQETDWPAFAQQTVEQFARAMERLHLHEAAAAALALIRRIDGYINATEPFKVAKDESRRDELAAILSHCAEALRIASLLLWPLLPKKMEELWKAMGLTIDPRHDTLGDLTQWGPGPGTRFEKVMLFPRIEHPIEVTATQRT